MHCRKRKKPEVQSCLEENFWQDASMDVKFKNVHPGVGGAAIPLPVQVKALIDDWVCITAPVNAFLVAVEKILPEAETKVDWKYKCILMKWKEGERLHCWKLIEFDHIEK